MIACSGLSSCACASSVHHQSTLVNILFKLTNMVPLPDLFSTTRALECLRRASFTDRVPTGVQQSSAKTSTKLHERHLFPGSVNRILICFARYVLITFCKKRADAPFPRGARAGRGAGCIAQLAIGNVCSCTALQQISWPVWGSEKPRKKLIK
jgi:hypothetical protein